MRSDRLFVFATLLSIVVTLSGCAGTQRGSDRTNGLRLEVDTRDGTNTAARYRVYPDGTIGYVGGAALIRGTAAGVEDAWTGELSAVEISQLHALVEDSGLFDRTPESTGEPASRTVSITIEDARGTYSYEVAGSSPDTEGLETWLDRIARRRFGDVLDSLPRASGDEDE